MEIDDALRGGGKCGSPVIPPERVHARLLRSERERRDADSCGGSAEELTACAVEASCRGSSYSFEIVSSRFKIALATIVQAASSAGANVVSYWDSPFVRSAAASLGAPRK